MDMKLSSVNTKRILWTIVIDVVAVTLFFGIQWATYARPPLPEAVAALTSDEFVTVSKDPWLTFMPTGEQPETGFIFYPGGRIDPRGYASLMHPIASEGYLVIVPEMPINMAAFDPDAADEIITAYPQVKRWVIGGHSVGGVMAAQYTVKHQESIAGLVFWAAYPAENANLSDTDLPVVLIYGSLDPRVNDNSVAERKDLLPSDAVYVRIEGGGHHQFGAYQIEPDEHQAAIPRTEQHAQILEATLGVLRDVRGE